MLLSASRLPRRWGAPRQGGSPPASHRRGALALAASLGMDSEWTAVLGSRAAASSATAADIAAGDTAAPHLHPATGASRQEVDEWARVLTAKEEAPLYAAVECGSHCTRALLVQGGRELVRRGRGRDARWDARRACVGRIALHLGASLPPSRPPVPPSSAA